MLTGSLLVLGSACSSAVPAPSSEQAPQPSADAPLVAAQPGAWFDAQGNLSVVGAGRRLRLLLSAPVSACAPAFSASGSAADVAAHASLPFHVLAEACRLEHAAILLPAESEGASPSELEHNYHEVARCAASELGATEGWVPQVVADGEPCSAALGQGWRLPKTAELMGLTIDDRKAIAGALFDTLGRSTFGSLLVYARGAAGQLELATLSPNAAEQAPALDEDKRHKPLSGAALRCVRDVAGSASAPVPTPPPQPYAAACIKDQRAGAGLAAPEPRPATVPELQKLKAWVEMADRNAALLKKDMHLHELTQLLAAPALDQLARDAREERALTERYAELAESLDDPAATPGERERRRAEFDGLRKRLGGQIVNKAEARGAAGTELSAVLQHLQLLLERHQADAQRNSSKKRPIVDYTPALTRVRELRGASAKAPAP